jgi:hypothetical protein
LLLESLGDFPEFPDLRATVSAAPAHFKGGIWSLGISCQYLAGVLPVPCAGRQKPVY